MKRKLLAGFMAVCLILTLLPATALAAVTTEVNNAEELSQAIKNASSGDVIRLTEDITVDPLYAMDKGYQEEDEGPLDPAMTINEDITLDLNRHKIQWDIAKLPDGDDVDQIYYTLCFLEVDGADLTIVGDGTIDAEAQMNNSYGIDIMNNGNVVIKDGTFTGATSAVQVQEGTLTILGGTFKQADTIGEFVPDYAKYVINCIDSAFKDGTARISLRGGTYCYDYSDNPEGTGTTYVAAGYKSTRSGSTWTVSAKESAATETPVVSEEGTASTTVGGKYDGSDITVTVNAGTDDKNTTSTEVTIASNTLETVVDNTTVQNMEIKTDVGTLTVTKDALSSMKENATTGTVEVPVVLDVILSVSKDENVYTLEAKNTLGEPVYAKDLYRAGNVTVTVPYAEPTAYVYYLSANDPVPLPDENVNISDGYLSWTVDHFSDYAVLSGEAVASVTDKNGKVTPYDSLQAAINAAGEKATVTLLQDTQEDINISNGKDIVLELNGKKITNSTATHTITVALGGKLTVQDTVGGGIVDNVSHGCAAIWNNGTTVLNGGKYDRSQENDGNSYYVLVNHGKMEINDGVTVEQKGHYSSMIENGYYSYNSKNPSSGYVPDTNAEYPSLTINGGSFSGGLNTVKNDDGGKLEIKGGNFSNVSQAVVLNWNEAEISGGTFTVTEAGVESVILNGYAADAIDQGKLTITGGTFTSHTGAPVLTTMNNSAAQHSGTIEITGGTLNGDIVLTDPQAGGTLAISQGAVINGDIINRKVAAVTVTGGTVTGQVTNSGNGKITVTGGSFPNADVSGFVPDGYYTVTFNCAGGDPIPSLVVAKDETITLPGCTHSSYHYKFDGWKCGNATYYAGDEVKVNSNMTFTAQWKERFPDGPSSGGSSSVSDNEYAVTVDAGKHGDVSVSPKWAEEGDTVTITADPDNGYVVDEVIVTDKNGDDIRVRDRGDGEYTFTMPDSKVTVEVTFVEAGDELSFVDVAKSDYYYDAVKWAVENGVTTGVTDTIFAPGNPCTRAQTVTFLWRAAGMPQAANRVNPFTDVSVNDYYYEAVLWAVENGITGGTTATTFSPNATCTRAQVVTFLWRYSKEDASILPVFTDVAEGDYYYGAVAWAVENGVTTGVTDTSFVPGNPCTRGQIVTFLYRYMGK